jgi:hypothetical protein
LIILKVVIDLVISISKVDIITTSEFLHSNQNPRIQTSCERFEDAKSCKPSFIINIHNRKLIPIQYPHIFRTPGKK